MFQRLFVFDLFVGLVRRRSCLVAWRCLQSWSCDRLVRPGAEQSTWKILTHWWFSSLITFCRETVVWMSVAPFLAKCDEIRQSRWGILLTTHVDRSIFRLSPRSPILAFKGGPPKFLKPCGTIQPMKAHNNALLNDHDAVTLVFWFMTSVATPAVCELIDSCIQKQPHLALNSSIEP